MHKLFGILLPFLVCSAPLISSGERGSSAPFISGDTFRAYADHIFDETQQHLNPKMVKAGDIIFVKTDWEYLDIFFSRVHPEIGVPYILLTHNSDHCAPGPFRRYLDDPKIIAWFAQNMEGDSHPKLHPVPIGIANRYWDHGNPHIFNAYLPLAGNKDRPILCYLNFEASTYPKEREHVRNLFVKKPWCVVSKPLPMPQYLDDLAHSKFVLSPRGNGLDCHRTWEALLMGAIPIVRTSSLDSLYAGLPVLVVPDWEIINEDYLNKQYEILKQKSYDQGKIYIEYWIKCIR